MQNGAAAEKVEAALADYKKNPLFSLRERLAQSGIKNRVQRKASRTRKLTPHEIRRNVLIARVRGRIESVFGTLKRSYGLARMRYMGLMRNTLAVLLALTAWNLARVSATP